MSNIRQELPPHILDDCPKDADEDRILERARHTIYCLRPFQAQAAAQWQELAAQQWLLAEVSKADTHDNFLKVQDWIKTYHSEHKLPDHAVLDPEGIPCTCGSGAHPRKCLKHPWGFHTHCAELDFESIRANFEEAETELEETKAQRDGFKNKCELLAKEFDDQAQKLADTLARCDSVIGDRKALIHQVETLETKLLEAIKRLEIQEPPTVSVPVVIPPALLCPTCKVETKIRYNATEDRTTAEVICPKCEKSPLS